MLILQNLWWLLVLIGVMILIHELGHFWAARIFDVRVETFSIGFGPRLFGFRRGDTDFRFSAILFGGYVKMVGEHFGDENVSDPRSVLAKPRWQRLIIAFAGPFMNILLAVAILAGLFMVRYPKLPSAPDPTVGYVLPDSAAAKAGVQEGDRIVQIDNTVDPTWDDIAIKEAISPGHPTNVWVVRNGQRQHLTVTPVADPKNGVGFAGWGEQSDIEIARVSSGMGAAKAGLQSGDLILKINGSPVRATPKLHDIVSSGGGRPVVITYSRNGAVTETTVQPTREHSDGSDKWMIGVQVQPRVTFVSLPFPQASMESIRQNAKSATVLYQGLRGIIERRMSPKSLSGPIGIAQLSGDAAREGATSFFFLMSQVSLQLAILNLLPIPIMDGGVILMLLVEMFMRRDLSVKVKETVFKLSFVFLMLVMAFALYNDIAKLAG